jgi:CYTH domain-containing protein
MSSNVEIERKFLMCSLPKFIEEIPAIRVDQGFLNADKNRVTRIRVTSENEAYLTVKGLSNGATRVEIETKIDVDKARDMLNMVEGSIVSKLRRKIIFGSKVWEIDQFIGANEGLLVAEIELSSEDEKFDIPPWVGMEVTTDARYANSNLALNPIGPIAVKNVKP